ncbi:MAG: PQQ-dependent sugar dehydrogenase [Bacteroidota bacterium]
MGSTAFQKTNPFNNEIFAYGFRNPNTISWTKKGDIIAANIGHRNIESLYVIKKGQDYGWPEHEGSFVLKYKESMDWVYPENTITAIVPPVAQYDHDEGNAISGGNEYWGAKIKPLIGKYIFGDIVKGRVFYVENERCR